MKTVFKHAANRLVEYESFWNYLQWDEILANILETIIIENVHINNHSEYYLNHETFSKDSFLRICLILLIRNYTPKPPRQNIVHSSLKENEIGITEYTTKSKGFTGIIKQRLIFFRNLSIFFLRIFLNGFNRKICILKVKTVFYSQNFWFSRKWNWIWWTNV